MPASMATKLGIQFARFAQYTAASAASSNASATHGLRNAFTNASNGSTPTWAQGLSSSGSASANGTGVGGAKFQAGRGAHSSFQNSGRTIANANASTANDGNAVLNDEDDDVALHSMQGAARVHRPSLEEGRRSMFQRGLRSRFAETSSSLQLILPNHHGLYINRARAISTSRSNDNSATLLTQSNSEIDRIESSFDEPTSGRHRSLSASASAEQEGLQNETISSDSLSTPPIGIGGIAVAGNSMPSGKTSSSGDADFTYMYDELRQALQSRKKDRIRATIDKFRNSPKKQMSTKSFNVAMEAMNYLVQQYYTDHDSQVVLDLYAQMLESGCSPNIRTRENMIYSLCTRDAARWYLANKEKVKSSNDLQSNEEKISQLDADYEHAVALMDLTHSLGSGFSTTRPYNTLLLCCKNRGDIKVASHVLELLSQNNRVSPDGATFRFLLVAFGNDDKILPGETLSDFNSRKLQACQQIFDEFESFRSSEEWRADDEVDVAVWNAMISSQYLLGDRVAAIKMIEKLIGVGKTEEGERAAPRPNASTTKFILNAFLNSDDLASAVNWLERIVVLHSKVGDGQDRIMSLPNMALYGKIINNLRTMVSAEITEEDFKTESLDNLLPLVESANRTMSDLYKKIDKRSSAQVLSLEAWTSILETNFLLAKASIKDGRLEDANKFADFSLSYIQHQYEDYAESVDGKVSTLAVRNTKAVCTVIALLVELERFHDGAACFSYAAFAAPPLKGWGFEKDTEQDEDMQDRSRIAYNQLRTAAYRIMGDATAIESQTTYDIRLKAGADAQLHLRLTLEYVLLSLSQLNYITVVCRGKVRALYGLARKQGSILDMELSALQYNHLLFCFSRGTEEEYSIEDVSAQESFFQDLAALPHEIRDQLYLQDSIRTLPLIVGFEKAYSLLQAIRPAMTMENLQNPGSVLRYDGKFWENKFSSVGSTDAQSDTTVAGITSPLTAATSMEGETDFNAAAQIDFTPISEVLPIQTIDVDFGQRLVAECHQVSKDRDSKTALVSLGRVYDSLKRSIEECGTYPSPDGICALLNCLGRHKDLPKVNEVYAMGSNVVAALSGDPAWQLEAWFELEDGMIAALSHGGDPKLASEHRHKLISAGRPPKADTYAALITVIRDTTDDALVAEELFNESQRLGVRPTVYLYNTVLSKLSRARKADRAMQLFEEMRDRGLPPSSITYGAVLNACTRTGDEANAERFYAMMESDARFRPGVPPFNTMVQFYVQTKPNREKALYYYNKFRSFRLQPNSHTYKLLLDLYGSIEPVDIDAMNTVFGNLIADNKVAVQGNHWASLIAAHGTHCKDLNKATELYHAIPTHLATIKAGRKGQEPDALSFEALLSVFLENERLDLIEDYIADRKEKGCEMTAYVANVLIKAYSAMDAESGLTRARAVFEEMRDPPVGVAAAGNHPLQRQHVSGAQEEETMSSSRIGMEGLWREPSTFETMIRVELDHGKFDEAATLIERMQKRGYPPVVVARAQEALAQASLAK